jgi:oxygen-independent coproporphyrinogen III oxidase
VAKGAHYTQRVLHEIRLIAPLLDPDREVVQLHLGGGTPNFLGPDTLMRLIDGLSQAFHLSGTTGRDFSIELDPQP